MLVLYYMVTLAVVKRLRKSQAQWAKENAQRRQRMSHTCLNFEAKGGSAATSCQEGAGARAARHPIETCSLLAACLQPACRIPCEAWQPDDAPAGEKGKYVIKQASIITILTIIISLIFIIATTCCNYYCYDDYCLYYS